MPNATTLIPVGIVPALVKTLMIEEQFLALGETKHHEYYDGMCVVNPPNRLHGRATWNRLDDLVTKRQKYGDGGSRPADRCEKT